MSVEGQEGGIWGQRPWWHFHRRWWEERKKNAARSAKPSKALEAALGGHARKKTAAKRSPRK
jgi:hypothetical protein